MTTEEPEDMDLLHYLGGDHDIFMIVSGKEPKQVNDNQVKGSVSWYNLRHANSYIYLLPLVLLAVLVLIGVLILVLW